MRCFYFLSRAGHPGCDDAPAGVRSGAAAALAAPAVAAATGRRLLARLVLAASCCLLLLPGSFAQQNRPALPPAPGGLPFSNPRLALLPGAPALQHPLPALGPGLPPAGPAAVPGATRPSKRGTAAPSTAQRTVLGPGLTEEWAARYNGPADDYDQASALAVDAAGNVYVTGSSYGNSTGYDYATVKYDGATGAQQWVARYNGPANDYDQATALAVDAAGNVYVTGISYSNSTGYDYATVKYDGATGQQQWVARYNGPDNSTDRANALTVDAVGNVYVTGSSYSNSTSYDYATVKYDGAMGAQQWVARYNGPANSDDLATALAMDAAGNVYVTGVSFGNSTSYDYATVKYDRATGAQQWVARYNGPADDYDRASALAVDAAGNVYVTGSSYSNSTSYDYATVKYDGATGAQQWVARYNGPANSDDQASALAVDAAGNVYVTGSSVGNSTNYDYATVKYDGATGAQQWVARYNGPANSDDQASALAVDAAGNVYVTGSSYSNSTSYDYATVKYDGATGAQQWVARHNGPDNDYDQATALAVDATGNVYVTGGVYSNSTNQDYATVKYSQVTATPPVLSVSNLTVPAAAGQCSAPVALAATATGTPVPTITYALASGPIAATYTFPVGATTVTATATNSAGTDKKTFTVTVLDNQAPTITAPANLTVNTDANQCSASSVALGTPTTADNCTGVVVTNNAPATFPKGTTTVTWTATDASGNKATATQTVTVTDREAPRLYGQATLALFTEPGQCTAERWRLNSPAVSEACGNVQLVSNAPAAFPKGSTTVTWTATDAAGNVGTLTQVVTVTDNERPTLTIPANLTVSTDATQCAATNVALGTPTATDNCSVVTVTNNAPAIFPQGTTGVLWTATDASGNFSTDVQYVTVVDDVKPTLVAPAAVTVGADAGQCTASNVVLGTPTATDNCAIASVFNDAPATFPQGTTTVTWTAYDNSGNQSTTTQLVTVRDNVKPTIVAPAAVAATTAAGQCAASGVVLGTPTAADNCSGVVVTNNAPTTFAKGTTTVTWTATDASGNTATATQTVTVTDRERPTLTTPAAITALTDAGQCAATNVLLGTPTAADNCPGVVVTNNAPAAFPKGTTTVTWTATDASGNKATTTQTVTVVDAEQPTLTAPATVAAITAAGQCAATNVALGTPVAADNCPGVTVTNNAPASFAKGTNTVTWTAIDAAGNKTTATQTVTVTDRELPTIVAPAAVAATTAAGQCAASSVALGTPTAADNCPGVVVTNNAPATFPKGTTTVTWTATDAAGNKTTATQTVTVTDAERPTLTAPAAVAATTDAGQCAATNVALGTPIAADNCPGVVVTNNAPASFAKGTTTVTWTATDVAGNKTTATQTVTVRDVTPPTALTRNLSVALVNGAATITAAQVDNGSADACGPVTLALSKTSFSCANAGANTVTLTVTDAAGNVATAPATVTVTGGAVTPSLSVAPASLFDGKQYRLYLGYGAQTATLTASGGTSYTWSPATGLSNPNVASPTFAPTKEGTYTFTVTATSAGGCAASTTVTIVVEDVRCGNNNDKVQVCHNGQVICIASSALSTHLAHGDRLGSCAASRTTALAATSAAAAVTPALAVYPNPTSGAATLTGAAAGASVTVLDAVGRVVLSATADATGTAALALPAELPGGVYVVRAGQQALRLTVQK